MDEKGQINGGREKENPVYKGAKIKIFRISGNDGHRISRKDGSVEKAYTCIK